MERLVIDTNSIVQILPRRSRYHDIWLSLFDGRNILCVTNEILEEYEEILERKTTPALASAVLKAILNNPYTCLVTPYFHFELITEDPDDNKFVDCAVCGNAKFIVTEDRHFSCLKEVEFPYIDIMSLDEALKSIMR